MIQTIRPQLAAAVEAGSLDDFEKALQVFKKIKDVKSNGQVEIGLVMKTIKPLGVELGQKLVLQTFALTWLKRLVADEKAAVRCMACVVLGEIARTQPATVVTLAHKLAADERWEVRECIANAFDDQVSPAQPEFVYQLMSQWVTDPSPNVRRCVTNSLMRYGIQKPRQVIALMNQLRHDDSDYVRKNVRFCLQQIAKTQHPILGKGHADNPDLMLSTLRAWAKDTHPGNRWIVAGALGNVWAKHHVAEAIAILDTLANDENRNVRGAVALALRDLAKYEAEAARAAAQRWAQDLRSTVKHTGELALKKLS